MKNNIKFFLSHVLIISIIFVFSSCGIWRDFTGYFNGYYNAANLFDEAEKEIVDKKKDVFTLQEPNPDGTTGQNFTKVIEKLSKLLQFNSKSNLVDDALLMVGKSFYYQKNYQKAARKFNELISTCPESGLIPEAKLWIAKSHLRMNDFDKALEILNEVYKTAEEKDNNSLLVDGYFEEISYLISKEKVAEAISKCKMLLEVSEDDFKNASVMYKLGVLYQENNELENSAKAFADVQKYSPDFQTEYNAKLEYGKVQRELGQYQKSLDVFEDIRSETIYNEYLDKTDLEIGISLIKLDKFDEAFDKLRFVDTSYTSTPSSGIAAFHLGELIEYKLLNFDSAKVFYQRAVSSSAPLEVKDQASKKVQVLGKLNNLHTTIIDYSKKLLYSMDSTIFKTDSIAYVQEKAKIDSLNEDAAALQDEDSEEQEATNERKKTNTNSSRSSGRENRNKQKSSVPQKYTIKLKMPARLNISVDSIKTIIAKYKYELAGLFFTELNVPDSANYYYTNIITEFPNSPYTARTLYALGTYYLSVNNKAKADSFFTIVYEKYPNESIANSAAQELNKPLISSKHDPADSLYRNAEIKINNENYSEAVAELINIYKEYPTSQFAPKALYAGGWLLENKLLLLDSAAVIYDSLSEKYSSSVYANEVKSKLSNYKSEQKKALVSKDSANSVVDSLTNKTDIKSDQEKIAEKPVLNTEKKEDELNKSPKLNERLPEVSLKPDSTAYKPEEIKMMVDSLKNNLQIPKKDSLITNTNRER